MSAARPFFARRILRFAALVSLVVFAAAPRGQAAVVLTAGEAIRQAVVDRMGEGVEVAIVSLDLPARGGFEFRDARMDPSSWLGRPMRVTMVPVSGSPVTAVVTLNVIADHVVARRDIGRGETIAADDVSLVREELRGTPMRRLPAGVRIIGGRVLRPIAAGAVLLPGAVAVRRAVEPGDRVTVMAVSGDIEVSATLVAADGGEPGDMIRVTNPDTRRDVRGMVIKEGLVEVRNAR